MNIPEESIRLSGNIVDLVGSSIFPGSIFIKNGKIEGVEKESHKTYEQYLLPGFIDAHVHIESSMLVPSEFARLAVVHGTVATVSDPHEIGNVLGLEGVRYMIYNGYQVPFHFYFGAPSCVPATQYETSGAVLSKEDIQELFEKDHLKYLSEMMNFPGVIQQDSLVMDKIAIAKKFEKPIDGHAPGLRGNDAACYISAGISTDHECYTLDEALDKLKKGMKIIIREGSAAKNYEALHPIIASHPEMVMFCSDDKHPHELVEGHINQLVKRSVVDKKYPILDVLRCASVNPIRHYGLDVGLLQPGDSADLIIVSDLVHFNIKQNYIKGQLVAENGISLIPRIAKQKAINHFHTPLKTPDQFHLSPKGRQIRVIEAVDGQLITRELVSDAKIENGNVVSDPAKDVLKLVVVNRYENQPPALGFIKNFGLKKGALASCIAHDSHNIIAVGTSDKEICNAVNAIIQHHGGIAATDGDQMRILALPVAGIMSSEDGYGVAERYSEIDAFAKKLGTPLQAPFMTLSFMALLVIPSLKLSDKGLFDGTTFTFTDIFIKD